MSNTLPWPEQTTTRFDNRMSLQTRVEQRAAIVALSKGNFKPGVISIFTDTHPSTARRWICRVEEGKTLIDLPRCGRPRTFSEGARLMTIAVYCQHAPPLPGLHLWSLRDAQRYFKEHTDSRRTSAPERTGRLRRLHGAGEISLRPPHLVGGHSKTLISSGTDNLRSHVIGQCSILREAV